MKTKKCGQGFHPYEIIFCPTSNCNLKCAHCFVTRGDNLNVEDAVKFLRDCVRAANARAGSETADSNFSAENSFGVVDRTSPVERSSWAASSIPIEKVGFSGGEPFLALDFVCEICRVAVENDLMFDNLMTNGVWWKTEDELRQALKKVYDAGFDGKIGLSWDSFHGQSVQKIAMFINAAHEIFHDTNCVEIWSVIPNKKEKEDDKSFKEKIEVLARTIGGKVDGKTARKKGCGEIVILGNEIYIPIYRFSESAMPSCKNSNQKIWHDKKWFKEDFCESTGQVLYVHANGKIAPCCGFANECESLIIGTVKDSFETVMHNASENKMVKICYEEGLSKYTKRGELKKLCGGKRQPQGKTKDMCQFCAWVSKNITS